MTQPVSPGRILARSVALGRGRARQVLTPGLLTIVVLAGQAMASLDTAIVNVAGPAIQHDLRLSGSALQLAIYSYLLAYAVSLVIAARLGARHGFGRLFGYGVALFTVSSLACGLSVSTVMLVAARTAQGIGGALLVPQVLSLLQITFSGAKRRRAMSAYGLVLAVGVAAGQMLGGIVVSADLLGVGWRPVFLVNVPVGLAVLAAAAGRLPNGSRAARGQLDLPGAGWLGAGVVGLLVPMTFGPGTGWPLWTWPVLAAGAAALVIFARRETRLARDGHNPLVPPALLARPGVRTGLVGILMLHAGYGGLLFTTALYLQHTLGQSPLTSGLTFAAYAAGFAAASLTWTRTPATWQPRLPQAAFAAFSAAAALLAWLTSTGTWPWPATALLALAGAAHGTGFGALSHRASLSVPDGHTASFSGVLATSTQLAITTGIAAIGTLYLTTGSLGTLPPMSVVLLALAAALAATGTAMSMALTRRGRRSPAPARVPAENRRGR